VVPKLSETPGTLRTPAPRLGEDTDAVLREAGLADETIAALRAKGVLG
jgi:formyl-CoA transferase